MSALLLLGNTHDVLVLSQLMISPNLMCLIAMTGKLPKWMLGIAKDVLSAQDRVGTVISDEVLGLIVFATSKCMLRGRLHFRHDCCMQMLLK